jgi:hypothetical protein
MIRTITFAAIAAALIAGPAAAQSVRVSTVGKTPEQVRAEIAEAARKVCMAAAAYPLPMEAFTSCRKHAIQGAMAQLNGGTAVADAAAKVAQR